MCVISLKSQWGLLDSLGLGFLFFFKEANFNLGFLNLKDDLFFNLHCHWIILKCKSSTWCCESVTYLKNALTDAVNNDFSGSGRFTWPRDSLFLQQTVLYGRQSRARQGEWYVLGLQWALQKVKLHAVSCWQAAWFIIPLSDGDWVYLYLKLVEGNITVKGKAPSCDRLKKLFLPTPFVLVMMKLRAISNA